MMMPLYSWPTFRDPFELHLDGLGLDGVPRMDLAHADHRRVRLDGAGGWNSVRLDVRVEAPPGAQPLLPDSVHLLVSAPRAQTRHAVRLAPTGGSWSADVELPRAMLAGVVTAVAEATSTVDGRIRLVGRSEEWRLVVDAGEAPVPPGGEPFPMIWVNFASPKAPEIARRNRHTYAVMALSPAPVLYLNEGIEGLHALLNAETARGERRRARALHGCDLARPAGTTIVRAAVSEVAGTSPDEDPTPPSTPLLRQTLDAVAGALASPLDLAELCERIARSEAGSAAERATLWADIDAAVVRLCSLTEAVADVAKEARNA